MRRARERRAGRHHEQAIAGRARNRQIKVEVPAHSIRDLHILEHVLDRKMRLEVCSNDLRHLQVERAGIAGVLLERIQKFFQRNA